MLQSLFQFAKPEPRPSHEWLHATYMPLVQAQRNRTFIWVTTPGDDRTYQSLILDSDTDEQTLLIDELFPGPFEPSVGQTLNIHIRQDNGQGITFNTDILENHEYNGAPIHVVRMPPTLEQYQRRNAFRLLLDKLKNVESTFAVNSHNYTGWLKDLSISGLRLAAPKEAFENMTLGDKLYNVEFDFAGGHIDCDLMVRHIVAAEEDEACDTVFVGAEFDDILPQDSRHLEQAINRIQRQQRKQADSLLAN